MHALFNEYSFRKMPANNKSLAGGKLTVVRVHTHTLSGRKV